MKVMFFTLLLLLASYDVARADGPLTLSEFQQMQQTLGECKDNARNLYYDCQCVAIRNIDLTRQSDARIIQLPYTVADAIEERERLKPELLRKAYDYCADTPNIAVRNYESCVDWSITSREDFRDFCQCFAVRYTDRFRANGNSPFFNDGDARAEAIGLCNEPATNPLGLRVPPQPTGIMALPTAFPPKPQL